jgi:hypothetical protein
VQQNQNYDIGEVVGDIAGESFLARSSLATMANGAVLEVDGADFDALPLPFAFGNFESGGVFDSVSSSGMVGQYVLSTCLRAGRRMGLERKKSMPESRHSCVLLVVVVKNSVVRAYLYIAFLGVSSESDDWRREAGLPDQSCRL